MKKLLIGLLILCSCSDENVSKVYDCSLRINGNRSLVWWMKGGVRLDLSSVNKFYSGDTSEIVIFDDKASYIYVELLDNGTVIQGGDKGRLKYVFK